MASLALFSWGRRTGAIVLLLAFACLLPLPAFANGGEADYDIFGEVNIAGNIQKKVEQRVNEAIEGSSSGKNIIDRGFLLEGVMSNQWIITRSIINGFGDINSAIGILEGPEFKRAAVADTIIGIYKTLHRERGSGALGLGWSGTHDADALREYVYSYNPDDFKGKSGVLEAMGAFTGELRSLQGLGFFGSSSGSGPGGAGTVYGKSLLIGFYLLGISLMSRLAFMGYESIVKEPHPPLAWFRVFFKFMLLILLLAYLSRMLLFSISMSDAIRDFITSSTFGSTASAGDTVGKLLRAKVDYLGIKPSTSFKDLFSSTASMFIAQLLGWLGYFIASAVLFVIVLLGDVMMAITAVAGPLIVGLSMAPSFESNFGHWLKGCVTLLFYGPLAAVYSVLLVAILTIGLDTSALAFIIISVSYIIGATNVPGMARNMSGAVLAGMAIGLASMPAKFASGALSAGAGGMLRSGAGALTGRGK